MVWWEGKGERHKVWWWKEGEEGLVVVLWVTERSESHLQERSEKELDYRPIVTFVVCACDHR